MFSIKTFDSASYAYDKFFPCIYTPYCLLHACMNTSTSLVTKRCPVEAFAQVKLALRGARRGACRCQKKVLLSSLSLIYRNPGLCRVPAALPSAFYRALGKEDFAESRTRQSRTLGKKLVYRARDTRHREPLGK
jgi:hypothetical protein